MQDVILAAAGAAADGTAGLEAGSAGRRQGSASERGRIKLIITSDAARAAARGISARDLERWRSAVYRWRFKVSHKKRVEPPRAKGLYGTEGGV